MARLSKTYQAVLRSCVDSVKLGAVAPATSDLFFRLLIKSDAFGNFHATPFRVAVEAYPRQVESGLVTVDDVAKMLTDLEAVGLIDRYTVGAEVFLHIYGYFEPQNNRHKNTPRYPREPDAPSVGEQAPELGEECPPIGDRGSAIDDRGSAIGEWGVWGGLPPTPPPVPESGTTGTNPDPEGDSPPPSAPPARKTRPRKAKPWEVLMDEIPEELRPAWEDYHRYRAEAKLAALTERTLRQHLAHPAPQVEAAYREAVEIGWQGAQFKHFKPDGSPVNGQVTINGKRYSEDPLAKYLNGPEGPSIDVNGRKVQ